MKFCLDVLGAAKYPDVVIKNVPTSFGIGVFAKEFGDAVPFVKKAIQAGFTFFRIHLVWDNLHNYGDQYLGALQTLSKLYNSIALSHPHVQFELSPFCEHILTKPDKYLDYTQKYAPNCVIVNSPGGTPKGHGAHSKKYKNETHGLNVSADANFSFDGSECADVDMKSTVDLAEYNGCENFFLWRYMLNLHSSMTDGTRNHIPTPNEIKQIIAWAKPKAPTSLPHDAIWKSISEKDFPVIITPLKTNKVTLQRSGKVIATLPYYGPYIDGRSRYYAPKQGYQLGACEVWINNKKYGDIDGAFRENAYR